MLRLLFGLCLLINLASCSSPHQNLNNTNLVQQIVVANKFTHDRGLQDYIDTFGPEFENDLKRLRPESHWLDGGSGEAYPQKDFLGSRDGKKTKLNLAKLTAVTFKYEDRPIPYLMNNHLTIVSGRFFEDIPEDEFDKVDLITDFFEL